MDPSKSRGSQKSHGRGNRGRVRPQVSSQPMYPQPPPPMPQQYSQSGYYPQPPPPMPQQYPQSYGNYPQPPPMNPTQYNISMTSDFNPFGDYREGPSRREPSVEREAPLYYQDDDDVEIVPETQPQIDEHVEADKGKTKADRVAWTSVEEVALAKAWIHVSTCRKVGNAQKRDKFWDRITEHFKTNIPNSKRTHHSLNTKWKNMNHAMGIFNGLYIQQTRIRESGCDDVNVMQNALSDYDKRHKGASFTHIDAWEIVKGEPKWLEQPCFEKLTSTSHSDKRRKSSESSYYDTGSNDNVDPFIPDLNDETTPVSKRKGKKAASEASTKNSAAEFIENYTTKKSLALDQAMAEKREKDDLSKQLLKTQLENANEKAMIRAYKFYNEPHEHITNPAMREFAIAKKRAYAEKYGWPADF